MYQEILKYLDIYGTKNTFYTNKKPKYYTAIGGILSIISIICCTSLFIIMYLNEFSFNIPNVAISSMPSANPIKIKFGSEKIWIPWVILDYSNKKINHENLLFPEIYYYHGTKSENDSGFIIKSKKVNYKLCNETSMSKKSEIYYTNLNLSEIYCIDMDELEIGGAWTENFIGYIQFDLYICKNGINYNENNKNCTTYENLENSLGEGNSASIVFYFPIVQFQPTNITHPILILYKEFFYQLSRFSNKIDRAYIKQNILFDDLGWVKNNIKENKYWGLDQIYGESYVTNEMKDIMSEGSTSRLYSLNLYIEREIIIYNRSLKKLQNIFSNFIVEIYIILILFKFVAKMFKKASSNKKLTELLFESAIEKNSMFPNFSQQKLKMEKNIVNDNINSSDNYNDNDKNNIIGNSCVDSRIISELNKKQIESKSRLSFINMNNNKKISVIKNNNSKILLNKFNENSNILKSSHIIHKKYIHKQLFPYKFYFFAIFLKNIDITKKSLCFSKKFTKVYAFLCQMLDLSSYLFLIREFTILKNKLVDKKYLFNIEDNKKINVSDRLFIRNINQCIEGQKFNIFSNINE